MKNLLEARKSSLSDLKKSPLAVLNDAQNGPIQIVNREKTVAYVVTPRLFESLVEAAKRGGFSDQKEVLQSSKMSGSDEIGVSEHEGLEPSQKEMLIQRATEMLGGRQKAIKWLNSPRAALSGKSPFEYAEKDVYEVINYIGRISHGVF